MVTGGINSPETLCCAKIPLSFEVDRYDGQTGKPTVHPLYVHCCLRGGPVIVGLETAVEMNLVQKGTNEFFPNPLFPIPANHPLLHRKSCACRASNCRRRARFSRTSSARQLKQLTNQPRKCRSDTIMARILAEKTESSLAPSHSFCRCTTFWRGTGFNSRCGPPPFHAAPDYSTKRSPATF